VLLGPLFLGHFAMPPILRRGRSALPLARFFHALEGRVASATRLILVVGFLLVEEVGFSYGDSWIWLAIVLVLVATAIGGAMIGPPEQRAIDAIEAGDDASRLILRIQTLGLVNVVNLGVILWLMIEKPGLG
jgi:uncharacterized membrane protein